MQFYIALLFTLVAVAAPLLIVWPMLQPAQTRIPPQPLAYAAISAAASLLVALLAPQPVGIFYKASVLLGLILVVLAAVLYFAPLLPAYAAHAFWLLVYVLYFLAFASRTRFPLPSLAAVPVVLIAAAVYWWIGNLLAEQWGAVITYALILALATWQTLELVVLYPGAAWAWAALLGMALLAAIHTLQAVTRFRTPLRIAPYLPAAILLAQCAIAWSVWGTAA